MEEETRETRSAPPRFRYKLIKIATLTLLFLAIFFGISFVGLETTSSSEFCASCHEMKPEFYTLKASTHSEVDCVNCHIEPGAKNLAKSKAEGVIELYKKQTKTYTAPIHMPKEIPDSACETCHNIFKRDVTPSGDLIIPHDKHKNKEIKCTQCHSGVAHGKIADRKMTFQADYGKWNELVGQETMKDMKWIKPDMETCMDCHKARKVTIECSTCHKTGMLPNSHKKEDFKLVTHGLQAKNTLEKCNECHEYMSADKLEGFFQEEPTVTQYLKKDSNLTKKSHYDYAKENSFCRNCHMKRPSTHTSDFMKSHGGITKENKQRCSACHNLQQTSDTKLTNVACSSCHPSSHYKNTGYWRQGHPIEVAPNQKLTKSCYRCHNEAKCSTCHTNVRTKE
jgi:nitrate/TMAO reductase-like tetraheme cytochrome c subunit